MESGQVIFFSSFGNNQLNARERQKTIVMDQLMGQFEPDGLEGWFGP